MVVPTHTGAVIERGGAVAARVVLTVLCALGVVAMHQMAATAEPANVTGSHAMQAADMATAHHGSAGVHVRVTDACGGHQTCQGLPSTSLALRVPSPGRLVIADTETAFGVLPLPSVDPRTGDPPDLHLLSVART